MIYFKDTYIKIWKKEDKDNYVNIQFSTSEKDRREEGKYINSSWLGRCVGKAKEQIADMDISERAKVKSGKVTNESYTDKEGNKRSSVRVTIFEFDTDGVTTAQAASSDNSGGNTERKTASEPADDDYPF